MSKVMMPKGMKIGAVSLWLMLLLSERPMYGYEIIRELEKRFSGYWKPKTGTIYPALEKLETGDLITSSIDFKGKAPDRKHYALAEKGQEELSKTMTYWTKMTEILENYRETHESIYRYKGEIRKRALAELLTSVVTSLKNDTPIEISRLLPQVPQKKSAERKGSKTRINLADDMNLKFLYAKENHKLEIHMELEWVPR
jgi:PadR family transcriptional regulator PadR